MYPHIDLKSSNFNTPSEPAIFYSNTYQINIVVTNAKSYEEKTKIPIPCLDNSAVDYMIYNISSSDADTWWNIESSADSTIDESGDTWNTDNEPFDIDHVYCYLNLSGKTENTAYPIEFTIVG